MKVRENQLLMATPTMHQEEMSFIQEAFDKNWVAPLGFNCDGFEQEMTQYLSGNGSPRMHSLCLNSGTSALHMAVKLAGIGKGDVVLASDTTFAATVNPIVYEGAVPVFVDMERDTWNMDPDALERAFEKYPQAKAVMLAHLYGTPAQMDRIQEVCRKHGAVLLEDAAEALSATYQGQQCGTFGKFSALSFNGNKIITTSGGGMLLTQEAEDRAKALFWATQARENAPWYQHEEIGYNYRLSNVLAGIGRGQLLHLDEHRARKEQIYRRYEQALKDLPVKMNPYLACSVPNFWLSCMLIDADCKVGFMDVIEKLKEFKVEARPIWKPMHMQPVFAGCDHVEVESSSVGADVFGRGLCLPSDIKMTEEDQEYVIEVIKSCF